MPVSNFSMPSLNKARRRKRLWSSTEIRQLRELAARGEKINDIAVVLRRSSAAVRTKAAMHGISIGSTVKPGDDPC